MDSLLILHVLVSSVVGGSFIAFQTWLAERSPQKIAGVVSSIPSTIAVALFFMAIATSPEAVAGVMPVIPAAIGGGLVFCIVYIYLANSLRLKKILRMAIAVLGAVSSWAVIAVPFAYFEINNIALSFGLYALLFLSALYLLSVRPKVETTPVAIHYTHKEKLIRAILGGVIIGGIVLASKLSGPLWGGILSTFPAVFSSTLLILDWRHGPRFLYHIAKAIPLSNPVFIVYAGAVAITYPTLGIVWGTLIAYGASFLYLSAVAARPGR